MEGKTLELFKTLTELPGAPGFEHQVRAFVRERISPYCDEIIQDRLGSVFGVRKGISSEPKIMVAGHMDEVGFMVTGITDNGMLKFQALGGWWSQTVMAQRVQVISKQGPVVGIVASVPTHLLDDNLRSKPVPLENMLIDIGVDSKAEAEQLGVRLGQPIVPVSEFMPLAGGKKILAKAWDNRYGVGLAIELLEAVHGMQLPNTLYSGATVQEEVGLRGALTAAQLIQPDLFFALDVSAANDVTGDKKAFGQLGKGALLRILDPGMVTNPQLVEFVRDMAETHRIPYQYYVSPGRTDAAAVQTTGIGVPSTVIGICGRYIHTSGSVIHTDDYAAAKALLIELVKACDRTTIDTITRG